MNIDINNILKENEKSVVYLADFYSKQMWWFQSYIDAEDLKQAAYLYIITRVRAIIKDNSLVPPNSHIYNWIRTSMRDLCRQVINPRHYPYNKYIFQQDEFEHVFKRLVGRELDPSCRIQVEELKDVFLASVKWDGLSKRESELYTLMLDGPETPNKILARAMGISDGSICKIKNNIKKKIRSYRPLRSLIK